jgi:hypothetical protein
MRGTQKRLVRHRRRRTRTAFAALCAALVASLCCEPQQDPTDRFVQRVRARTLELIAQHGIPGAAFAVVNREGVVFSQGFGNRRENGGAAVDSETLFSIGSISKVFVANAMLQDIIEEVAGVYPRIMKEGDMDADAWSCGMVAGLIHDIPTCKELIDRIMSEAEEIITQSLGGFLSA